MDNNLIKKLVANSPIIPVLTIKDIDTGLKLCEALSLGGLKMLEITLRTPIALEFLRELKKSKIDAIVAAGTVNNVDLFAKSFDNGADLVFTPGFTIDLLQEAKITKKLLIPGVATPSEVMTCQNQGYKYCKLYPVSILGGVSFLKALHSPFPEVKFCTTGGVNTQNYLDYLKQDNVFAIGGSWMADKELIANNDYATITARSKQVLKLIEN